MKIALCTTTIHVPHALKLLRKCSADVKFFVAGDVKTPHDEIVDFLEAHCHPASYIDKVTASFANGCDAIVEYKTTNAIGDNTLARRNIAFLEALKWGADVIYSWDDDNLSVDAQHFSHFEYLFDPALSPRGQNVFDGIKLTGSNGWFDPGTLLIPKTRHRGFSHAMHPTSRAEPITDAKIGVAAGLVIGDPDIDAIHRIEHHPDIGAVHIFGQTGVVVDPHTWTVFNSQNTAVIRELIPAWFMAPGCGRHDDIYASLIVQRVARERGYHVHFGPPFTYQQRNEHNLVTDLRAEIDGMECVERMATLLDSILLVGRNVVADTRVIYSALAHADWYPKAAVTAAMAWLEDVEGVL